ncbi:MAG: methylated-DNA--[protein]-cysteine S-methyltransferase [Holosporaceae bacterium]|jgi:methylated-DNA-[protein]-cysteine S-methyltransferase|nr:methylated-DNA--[protein]-cysteine S-methyltransferase [Holosporaceae bacterium]
MDCFCYQTIIGEMTILANKNSVTGVNFGRCFSDAQNVESHLIREAFAQLREYLSGSKQTFDLDLAPDGSIFQMSVWNELKKIPYGETKTYGEIAVAIGNPKSCRAVGRACGQNPISIFIPCHRVIGSDGNLTGYAGGTDIKKKLLEIERADKFL